MSTQSSTLARALPRPSVSLEGFGDTLARASAKARAFKTSALKKADDAATRISTNLSRVTFLGLLLLPILHASPLSTPPHHVVTSEVAPGTDAIRTRAVRTEHVAVKPLAGTPPPALAKTTEPEAKTSEPSAIVVAQTYIERTQHVAEPAKPQGDFPLNPKAADAIKADDPVKPATHEQTAEKDKPKPPPPVPPSGQPAAPWTEEQIAAANKECTLLLGKIVVDAQPEPPERDGICGAPAPRTLKSLGQSHVEVVPPQMLNCPMIAGLNTWLSDKLQPTAEKIFGSPITRILGASSYSCRNRYGLAKAPISEHAFMNALDISGFALANGRIIRVSQNWKAAHKDPKAVASNEPQTPAKTEPATSTKKHKVLTVTASKLGAASVSAAAPDSTKAAVPVPVDGKEHDESSEKDAKDASLFLHEVHDGACSIFGTVLGPDANDAHHDHFHLDMKERKYRAICE